MSPLNKSSSGLQTHSFNCIVVVARCIPRGERKHAKVRKDPSIIIIVRGFSWHGGRGTDVSLRDLGCPALLLYIPTMCGASIYATLLLLMVYSASSCLALEDFSGNDYVLTVISVHISSVPSRVREGKCFLTTLIPLHKYVRTQANKRAVNPGKALRRWCFVSVLSATLTILVENV